MLPAILLEEFETLPITESEDALFRNRYDTKYVFPEYRLTEILGALAGSYMILLYKGQAVQEYKSLYYDDQRLTFYRDHLRGKRNRFKVRLRLYPASGFVCLEIKMKTNKDATRKWRLRASSSQFEEGVLSVLQTGFVNEALKGRRISLSPIIGVHFTRLTLRGKEFDERVTIDAGLSYLDFQTRASRAAGDFVIAEVKQFRPSLNSPFRRLMRELRIAPLRFSKYCYGIYLFHPEARHNRLKPRYLALERKRAQWLDRQIPAAHSPARST